MALSLGRWRQEQLELDRELRELFEARLAELGVLEEIERVRKELGLTQSEAARIAGISQPSWAKLECGSSRNVELRTLVRVATALGRKLKIELVKDCDVVVVRKEGRGRGKSSKPHEARSAGAPAREKATQTPKRGQLIN
jgi:transcriptional regulator with XRE-family HTH domain